LVGNRRNSSFSDNVIWSLMLHNPLRNGIGCDNSVTAGRADGTQLKTREPEAKHCQDGEH
jgi:hypothetical protein